MESQLTSQTNRLKLPLANRQKREKRNSLKNLSIGITTTIIGAIFQFVLISLVIRYYGFQVNGFIKNTMALVAFIGSTESGVGIMCTVFLFRPLLKKDWEEANNILNTTHKQNKVLGFISLILLILIAIIYTIFLQNAQGGVHDRTQTVMPLIVVFGTIVVIGSKNLLSLFWTGALENLLVADYQNHIRLLIKLGCDLVVYIFVFALLPEQINIIIPFVIILVYSVLQSLALSLFVKKKYPWLHIKHYFFSVNFNLVKKSFWVTLNWIAEALLINLDVILISFTLGLNTTSSLAFYMPIIVAFRGSLLLLISSFKPYFASIISTKGRVDWNVFQKFELYSYIIAAFAFINVFILSPYVVNALFNGDLKEQLSGLPNSSIYRAIFFHPTFSLLIALVTTLILITEPINMLVYARNRYIAVSKIKLIFGIANVLLSVMIALILRATEGVVPISLYSILIVQIGLLLLNYCFLWGYNWFYLTYCSNLRYSLKNLVVLVIPILFAILLMYDYLWQNPTYSYNALGNDPFTSQVTQWTFRKFIAFIVVEFFSAFGLTFLVGFLTRPKVTVGFFLNLPIINYLYQKVMTKKMQQKINVYGEYQFQYTPTSKAVTAEWSEWKSGNDAFIANAVVTARNVHGQMRYEKKEVSDEST